MRKICTKWEKVQLCEENMRKMVKYAQNMRKVVKYARAYLYAQSGQICAHMRAHISTMPVL